MLVVRGAFVLVGAIGLPQGITAHWSAESWQGSN